MRSISVQLKDSIALPLFVVAFFLFISIISANAAEPDTSKSDNCKVKGAVEGAGEVAYGFAKGADETLYGLGQGIGEAGKGFSEGFQKSAVGLSEGTANFIGGTLGPGAREFYEGKPKEKASQKSEEATAK